VPVEKYGYGRNLRKLVTVFEKGEIMGCASIAAARFSVGIYDVHWRMPCWQADKPRMEKLREHKATKPVRLAARRQGAAANRPFNGQ
jgi:hypothetical protein